MPAHLKLNEFGYYYLVDGYLNKSLKTKTKRYAEAQLKQYNEGKFILRPLPTVGEYYQKWIARKVEPLYRRGQIRDYKYQFKGHILPRFEGMRLSDIRTGHLRDFQVELVGKQLAVKTVRNIIDASFRAMFRDARAEYEELEGRDPFIDIEWSTAPRAKPDPFSANERNRIIDWYIKNDFFYYPWVFTLFGTGMRPSEASALIQNDIDLETRRISISKSRYMGTESAPKTSHSNRTIEISEAVAEVIRLLPSRALGLKYVFLNKLGEPMNAKKWSEHNWAGPLKQLEIRHRKFYATRHTFITEAIRRGENPLAVAQYCGTSLDMIQKDYCGTLRLHLDREVFEKSAENPLQNMVAGPGFEPGTSRL